MSERWAVLPHYLLPQQALTRLAGAVARWQGGAATTAIIRRFIARYGVDMSEAAEPDPAAYASFNAFFTRALKPGARPLAAVEEVGPGGLLCPVDGAVSQFGAVQGGRLVQAKGHDYTATALLGGDAGLAARFDGGHFATLYLSPRDYHRVHMPCAGRLRQMLHVPGALFSVNPSTARGVPGLFARNERVVCVFDGEPGCGSSTGDLGAPWALVLVGACYDGSGINASDTLKNDNFKPHPALKGLLEWLGKRAPNQPMRNASSRALSIYNAWAASNKDAVVQMSLFLED